MARLAIFNDDMITPASPFAPQLQAMRFLDSNIGELSKEVGEDLAGRTGGAVTLAVGMAKIFW